MSILQHPYGKAMSELLNIEHVSFIYENAVETILTINDTALIFQINKTTFCNYDSEQELIGKNIFSLCDSANEQILRETLNKNNNTIGEIAFKQKNGGKIWHEFKTTKVKTFDGKNIFLIFARNISKRKNLETQLKKTNQNLEEIVRLRTLKMQEALSDLESFSFSISHDLKAPLRAIKGYSGIIQEELEGTENEEVADSLVSIKRNIDKMEKLISDILNLSRVGKNSTNLQPVNFQGIFTDKFNELMQTEQHRTVSFQVDDQIPVILFDPTMAKQLAQNLLSNAIKYTSKKEKAEIKVGWKKKGNEIVLFVKDNGAGFDEKYKEKLFSVFQRLHSEKDYPGTGVGLSIVKRIANRHEGNIWAEGKVNEGAAFFVSLPKKLVQNERN